MAIVRPDWTQELALVSGGADIVVGFDEVGRGALAGPVMVGCAAFRAVSIRGRRDEASDGVRPDDAADAGSPGAPIPALLRDSKMLTEAERERLFGSLTDWPDAWAVGGSSNQEIDDWGISHALGIAALRALEQVERHLGIGEGGKDVVHGILDGPSDYITKAAKTLDAPVLPVLPRITTLVKGDARCASVAAASCLAKVVRDRLMEELGRRPEFEDYGWASNKGYGTRAHREAIRRRGPSRLHRVSWHLV